MSKNQNDRTPPTRRLPFMEEVKEAPRESAIDYANLDRRTANPTRWQAAEANRPAFPGPSYNPEFDYERLTGQLRAVYDVMKDGRHRTLSELKDAVGKGSETGLSAALRALRKPQHGSHRIDKQRRGDPKSGLWEYYLTTR
jgi:hypothetical protein